MLVVLDASLQMSAAKKEGGKIKKYIKIGALVIVVLGCICLFGVAIITGRLNKLWIHKYDILGIDVSHYQGEIDWATMANQNIDFAFIKATEGSTYVDDYFESNWDNAKKTSIKIGAYHFFSFQTSGKRQAKHYIDTVGYQSGTLFPVVDVELYGKYRKSPVEKEYVIQELSDYLYELEMYYGVKPIIYTTMKTYQLYFSNELLEYPLWIPKHIL